MGAHARLPRPLLDQVTPILNNPRRPENSTYGLHPARIRDHDRLAALLHRGPGPRPRALAVRRTRPHPRRSLPIRRAQRPSHALTGHRRKERGVSMAPGPVLLTVPDVMARMQ